MQITIRMKNNVTARFVRETSVGSNSGLTNLQIERSARDELHAHTYASKTG